MLFMALMILLKAMVVKNFLLNIAKLKDSIEIDVHIDWLLQVSHHSEPKAGFAFIQILEIDSILFTTAEHQWLEH